MFIRTTYSHPSTGNLPAETRGRRICQCKCHYRLALYMWPLFLLLERNQTVFTCEEHIASLHNGFLCLHLDSLQSQLSPQYMSDHRQLKQYNHYPIVIWRAQTENFSLRNYFAIFPHWHMCIFSKWPFHHLLYWKQNFCETNIVIQIIPGWLQRYFSFSLICLFVCLFVCILFHMLKLNGQPPLGIYIQ